MRDNLRVTVHRYFLWGVRKHNYTSVDEFETFIWKLCRNDSWPLDKIYGNCDWDIEGKAGSGGRCHRSGSLISQVSQGGLLITFSAPNIKNWISEIFMKKYFVCVSLYVLFMLTRLFRYVAALKSTGFACFFLEIGGSPFFLEKEVPWQPTKIMKI